MNPIKLVKRLTKSLLSFSGYETLSVQQSYEHCRSKLINSCNIDLVLDVGANKGQYALSLRKRGYVEKIVSFEPLPEQFEELSAVFSADKNWTGVNFACGSESGRGVIHVSQNSVCSSLSPPTKDFLQTIPAALALRSLEIEVCRLDDAVQGMLNESTCALLKIDVQGFEFEVLKGAINVLEHAKILEIELGVSDTYESAFKAVDAIPYICAHGYRLASINRGFSDPQTGLLLDADFLFLRD
jgi:FkbM family methyltransferase